MSCLFFFFFQAEDGIRDYKVTGVQTCALPISPISRGARYPLERFRAPREIGVRNPRQSAGHRHRPLGAGLIRDRDSQTRPSSDDPLRRRSVPAPPRLDPAEPERSVLTDPGRKPGGQGKAGATGVTSAPRPSTAAPA